MQRSAAFQSSQQTVGSPSWGSAAASVLGHTLSCDRSQWFTWEIYSSGDMACSMCQHLLQVTLQLLMLQCGMATHMLRCEQR